MKPTDISVLCPFFNDDFVAGQTRDGVSLWQYGRAPSPYPMEKLWGLERNLTTNIHTVPFPNVGYVELKKFKFNLLPDKGVNIHDTPGNAAAMAGIVHSDRSGIDLLYTGNHLGRFQDEGWFTEWNSGAGAGRAGLSGGKEAVSLVFAGSDQAFYNRHFANE